MKENLTGEFSHKLFEDESDPLITQSLERQDEEQRNIMQ